MPTLSPEKPQERRSRVLSISERNRPLEDTIESIQMENGLSWSQAVFHVIREYDRLRKKIQNHDWAIVREML